QQVGGAVAKVVKMPVEDGDVGLLLLDILMCHIPRVDNGSDYAPPRSGSGSACQDGAALRSGGQVGRLTEQLEPHEVPVGDEEMPVDAAIRAKTVEIGELPPHPPSPRLQPHEPAPL